mgnify:CR=1 FL=1
MKQITFYGQQCEPAFHPKLSGEKKYTAVVSAHKLYLGEMIDIIPVSSVSRFRSIDDCIQWCYLKLEHTCKKTKIISVNAGVYDPDYKEIQRFTNLDSLLEKIWMSKKMVSLTNEDNIAVNWFIFPAGTDIEDIWKWFDVRYSGGVTKLMTTK